MKALLTAAAIALAATGVRAEFWDGNKLHTHATGAQGEQLLAIGYVMGVADSIHSVLYCPPANVSAGQIFDMVKNYLANVPGERHLTADAIVTKVLRSVWPCAQQRRPGTGV